MGVYDDWNGEEDWTSQSIEREDLLLEVIGAGVQIEKEEEEIEIEAEGQGVLQETGFPAEIPAARWEVRVDRRGIGVIVNCL